MAVRVVFLGKLADIADCSELELAGPLDWFGLLRGLDSALAEAAAGERVKVALNGTVLPDKAQLSALDGDEIALLPPVSGG